ncbi:MAG: tRNA (adenosine(37)-N6)-threonylcarbamoyltransferase complex dimerization subunit type 1 TsaB [Candidatus Omnitrophica bacterium]|nr:tRNA (adenosine(37)-N6)-threonylcarbamoyltransferase complex dimerization subunit type 1 TsaB [Candidatus Omnitrophota bacterium]MBU1997006.1 tRNA (adenosine(37)-N6)-threonylcarbamoyltransferase complex dimerization subunit type 1 TsaB [Candidatus Omnitrophota bacterium]
MRILSIDTSTKHFSLAVSENEKVLSSKNLKSKKVLSSTIIPAIEQVLKKAGVTLSQIDGFAVGLGPGSFTGLRVGVSTVKGLAYATNKPIVGIPSLDVLALNIKRKNAQVCTICDAKRNMVFGCVYDKEGLNIKKKNRLYVN